ncbi:MAG: hypothetical protein KJ069_26305 [Anaerolineae bacterium]|nr:hypothetical protein [Anaerolineae bacterium]
MRRMTLLLIVVAVATAVLALFTLSTPTAQADVVGGIIDTDTTWTLAGSPYVMTDTVTILPGVTLTIEAGVEVQAGLDTAVEVNGTLLALGTPSQPITFTSATETSPGDWHGIYVGNNADLVQLRHTTVQYADYGLGIDNATSHVEIENSSIRQNHNALIVRVDVLHQLQMTNVTFDDNVINRVLIDAYGNGFFHDLTGNTTLTPQPGLEGYEVYVVSQWPRLRVPQGITLSLAAGTTLMMPEDSYISVYGRLDAQGTITQPITLTSATGGGPGGWDYLVIATSGTAVLKHATVQHTSYGIGVYNNPARGITIENSLIQDNLTYPMDIDLVSLPGLAITNTTFVNNGVNRIAISVSGQQASLIANTRLTGQPGLEGYEVVGINFLGLTVPQNITLTLEPGSVFMMPQYSRLYVDGHLQANGETGDLVTFTSAANAGEGEWGGVYVRNAGTVHLDQAIIRYSDTGLFVEGNTYNPVVLSDTQIDTNIYAIGANPNSLHRLQMNNVTFADNVFDRFFIVLINPENPLIDNVTLTTHPGLEGYELDTSGIRFLVIPAGIEMNLEPGVQIMGQQNAAILVEGTLRSNGLPEQPVMMTSVANIGPGDWRGIFVNNNADVSLSHTEIRHSIVGIATGYTSASSTITMTNSRILSSTVGLNIYSGTVNVFCSTIAQNDSNGIFVENNGAPDVTINASEFWGNGAGITNNNSLPVDARYNFWGHPSGPGGIGPGSGDTVYGNVLYEPWLTEPTCSPPPPPITPTISISDSTAVESAPFLTFTVTLNITSEQDVLVDYVTVDGTAVAGVDYQPISGTLTISAGQVTAVLTVPLLDNDLDDGDRHFSLILSNPVNGELGNDTAIGLILDDDDPPIEPPITPTISISNSTAVESAPFLTFTITLNITGEQDVLVDYGTVDGTAVAHTDYLPISGTLTIPAGQVTAVITATLLNNDLDDGDRTFTLVLSNPVNAELGNDTAVGTILDDDAPPIPGWHIYLPAIIKP